MSRVEELELQLERILDLFDTSGVELVYPNFTIEYEDGPLIRSEAEIIREAEEVLYEGEADPEEY